MQRVIYSLELEHAGSGPQRMVLICPLDRDGKTLHS